MQVRTFLRKYEEASIISHIFEIHFRVLQEVVFRLQLRFVLSVYDIHPPGCSVSGSEGQDPADQRAEVRARGGRRAQVHGGGHLQRLRAPLRAGHNNSHNDTSNASNTNTSNTSTSHNNHHYNKAWEAVVNAFKHPIEQVRTIIIITFYNVVVHTEKYNVVAHTAKYNVVAHNALHYFLDQIVCYTWQ